MADGQPEEEITIEAKSQDDAWYPCSLKFGKTKVHVHFTDYESDEDEAWNLNDFKTRADVCNKVRITSEQLQDARCGDLNVGCRVCALKELDDDEKKYFDAEVQKIDKREHLHIGTDNEECKCKFTLKWVGGPNEGQEEVVDCSAITVLSDKNAEDHPHLDTFLKLVANRGATPRGRRGSASTGKKRRGDNRRASKSKDKAVSPETDEPASAAELEGQGQGGKENNVWQTPPAAQMTENEINSTINEVCNACVASPDWQSGSDSDAKGNRPAVKKMKGSPAHEPEFKTPSTRRVSMGDKGAEGSGGALRHSKSSGMEGRSLNFNTPTRAALPAQGSQGLPVRLSELAGGVDADTPVVNGCATPIGLVPEPEVVVKENVVLISDDEDEESHVQRSPQVNISSTKPESGCSQPQPVCNGSQMKQELTAQQSLCSGSWPIDSVLRIDNVEQGLDPHEAKKFLSAMVQELITVILSPSAGQSEQSTFGFAVFKDSESARVALNLLSGECLVTSSQQRPWLVSWARDTAEEKELIAYTARGNSFMGQAQENIEPATGVSESQQPGPLRWVLPAMKDFKLANDLLELFKDHKKEAQALRKRFNREEASRRLNFCS